MLIHSEDKGGEISPIPYKNDKTDYKNEEIRKQLSPKLTLNDLEERTD